MMAETATPGELAYKAYAVTRTQQHPVRTYPEWNELDAREQAAWEAAATAAQGALQ